METSFKIWETSRHNFLAFLDKYTLDQLNHIPQGYNNNLVWNIGHVVAVQQRLMYKSCNLPMIVSDAFFERYKPGSKPEEPATEADVAEIKTLLLSTIGPAKADYEAGRFSDFQAFKTMTGFQLDSIEDAIHFNNYHDGMHMGMMMSIRKFV